MNITNYPNKNEILRDIKYMFKHYEFNAGKSPYSRTSYKNKIVKHQPKRKSLHYSEVISNFYNNNSNIVSYTNLNIPIYSLKENIIKTAIRRKNLFEIFGNLYENGLKKYVGNNITDNFPEFYSNGRLYFDEVFKIKTENIHHFVMMDKIYDKKYLCEYIIICVKNKKYNIMFDSSKKIEITVENANELYKL